jgi:hypothetical protein
MFFVTATRFPNWSRETLEQAAFDQAMAMDIFSGRDFRTSDSVDRLVVNMLRHEFTDYDNDQRQEHHRLVCLSIKSRYVWLSEECDRQIERRARAERMEIEYLIETQRRALEERERRAERSKTSQEIIATFKVGGEVIARIGGRNRCGTVTWVGRKRVEIRYAIKSGEVRTRRLYASDLREAINVYEVAT